MQLRTVNVRLKPVSADRATHDQHQVSGYYTVEVDAALSPSEIRSAAIEALLEAIDVDDLSQFTVEVS
jgi:hypothetical protein